MPENKWVILAIGHSSSQFVENFLDNLAVGAKGHGLVAVGVHEIDLAPDVRRRIHKCITRAHADDISVESSQSPIELERLRLLQNSAVGYQPRSVLIVIDAEYLGRSQTDAGHAKGADVDKVLFTNLRIVARPAIMIGICITGNNKAGFEQTAYDTLEEHMRSQADRPPTLDAAFIVRADSPLSAAVGNDNDQNKLLTKSLVGMWTAPLFGQNPDIREQGTRVRQEAKDGQAPKTLIGMAVRTDGITMKKPKGGIDRLLYPILRHTTWRITPEDAANSIAATTYALLENWPVARTTVAPYPYRGPQQQSPGIQDIHDVLLSVNLIVPFRPKDKKFAKVANLVRTRLTGQRQVHPQPGDTLVVERGFHVNVLSSVKGRGVEHIGSKSGQFYYQVCVLFPIDQKQISTGEMVDPPAATQETRIWEKTRDEKG